MNARTGSHMAALVAIATLVASAGSAGATPVSGSVAAVPDG